MTGADVVSDLPSGVVRWRRPALLVLDGLSWLVALGAATVVRMSLAEGSVDLVRLLGLAAFAAVITAIVRVQPPFEVNRARIGSVDEVRQVTLTWAIVGPAIALVNYLGLGRPVPTLAFLVATPVALLVMLGVRFCWRIFQDRRRRPDVARAKRVLVFGAGEGGEQIVRSMLRDPDSVYVPVAILDDAPEKKRRSIQGVRVVGSRADLASAAKRERADVLLIAIPSARADLISELSELGAALDLDVRVLPSTSELVGMLEVADIREPTEADLLGRAEVEVDMVSIASYVTNKRVLVTGAGGSIGSELCRQISRLDPAELIMLDRDESALHGLQLSMEGRALLDTPNLVVADIRDAHRVDEIVASWKPEVIFHTAALKHLTLLEQNPTEGVKTNVQGSANLLASAARHGVGRFVNVSTDKAADPTSVLGATKLVAERLTARCAAQTGRPYVSVRFGNVLGSRGSVLPIFREQISSGGPVTVTDPDVTRYFMTIPEAVRLVLQAGAIGEPGEIMVLDMGEPVRIVDLANRLIRLSGQDVEIEFTGLRPGEKRHEVLIAENEVGSTREHPRITHTAGSVSLDLIEYADSASPAARSVIVDLVEIRKESVA